MLLPFALLVSTLLAGEVPASLPDGEILVYRGTFDSRRAEQADTRKDFELTTMLLRGEDQASYLWTLSERGRGGWHWTDRFGRVSLQDSSNAEVVEPALQYERDEGSSTVPLLGPVFLAKETLTEGASWQNGRLEFHVQGLEKIADREAWRIDVRNPFGHKRSLWVEPQTGVILQLTETVFIGQGQEHELRYSLADRKSADESDRSAFLQGITSLEQLRSQLGVTPRTSWNGWKEEQLTTLRSKLPAIAKLAEVPQIKPLVEAIERDAKEQKDRLGAVGALRDKLVGSAAPKFELADLTGQKTGADSLRGKVTVLHFWEYQDARLEEPYGQVAYLDFLHRNRKSEHVAILGVHVDERLNDAAARSKSTQSARRFHSFMNLSFPLLLDGGAVLKSFGDPRGTGAKLPLFVVIGRDGKVVHYHVGTYEVNRDRGLEELDKVIQKALDDRG